MMLNAKRKAMEYYLKVVIEGLPLKWKENALDEMLNQKQDDVVEKLKKTLDIAINEAKKEVFDDVDKVRVTSAGFGGPPVLVKTLTDYIEVKQHHLKEDNHG